MSGEMARVISEVAPLFVFSENVSAEAVGRLARMLRGVGYVTRGVQISAKDVGADHTRRRYWTLAYPDIHGELCGPVDAEAWELPELRCDVWKTGADELRVANGVADRVDRIKAIGNGQVPAVARLAWEVLSA
jgi:DNA (cytosine-5)-methyltransferase 1